MNLDIQTVFRTYQEADAYLVKYFVDNFHPVRRDNRTSISHFNKNVTEQSRLSLSLEVHSFRYVCKHYGKRRNRENKGLRMNQKILPAGCEFHVVVAYKRCQQGYQVSSYILTHSNHPEGVEHYKTYCTSKRSSHGSKQTMLNVDALKSKVSGVMELQRKFNSYEELEMAMKQFSLENNVSFYKRLCITIENAKRKFLKRDCNPELKYYSLRFNCIHGGKNFKSTSKGIKRKTTRQKGCDAHISLKLSKDGQDLEITSVKHEHNHDISKTASADSNTVNGRFRPIQPAQSKRSVTNNGLKIVSETSKVVTVQNPQNIDDEDAIASASICQLQNGVLSCGSQDHERSTAPSPLPSSSSPSPTDLEFQSEAGDRSIIKSSKTVSATSAITNCDFKAGDVAPIWFQNYVKDKMKMEERKFRAIEKLTAILEVIAQKVK